MAREKNFLKPVKHLLMLLLVTSAFNLVAYADSPWTLESTLHAADETNPTLQATRAQHGIARGGVIQAKTFPAPLLNFEVAPTEQTYRPVDVSTTIQTGGKRRLQIHIAKAQLNSTDATIQAMAWRIREDTEQAFYDYAVSEKVLAVMQDYQQVAEKLLDITRKRQVVGDVSGLDVLRAEAAVDDVRTQLPPVTTHVDEARRQINILLGRTPDGPFDIVVPTVVQMDGVTVRNTLPALPQLDSLVSEAGKHRFEYAQNKADLATQDYKLKLAKAAWWPNIQLGTALSMVPQDTRTYWGSNFTYGPAVYAQIPLTLVDHQQGPNAIARASIHQLEIQKYALDAQVAQELNLAYSNLDSSSQQLQLFLSSVLPRQKEIVTTSQRSYALGFIDLTAAITAQQTAMAARINAVQTLSHYFQSRVDLERAVGEPIDFDHVATSSAPSSIRGNSP